jgi:hypothetical protein
VLGRAVPFALRSAAAALAGLTWGVAASAQSPAPQPEPAGAPLELVWQGPAECERGGAVRAKVLRLLGTRQAALSSVKVTVTVARETPSRYVALLETVTGQGGGSKRLEGESCDAIALASSVVIALSIDPTASLDSEDPPPPPEVKPAPAPAPRRPPPPPRPPPEVRETKPYLHGSIGVLFRLVGDPSAFTAAGIGVRHRRLSLELGGAVYQPRDVTRPERPKVGAELRLFTGELLGCYAVVPLALVAFEACPGARVESLGARSFGVSNPDEGQVLLMSGLAVLRGRLHPTSWISATLDAGLAARPFHPTFVLLGVGNVFEIPVFSPFARTGLALEF